MSFFDKIKKLFKNAENEYRKKHEYSYENLPKDPDNNFKGFDIEVPRNGTVPSPVERIENQGFIAHKSDSKSFIFPMLIEYNLDAVIILNKRFIAFDCETSELSAVLFEYGEPTKEFSSLLNADEITVFDHLVKFLGDALNEETVICVNDESKIKSLASSLMQWGYDAKIYYADISHFAKKLVYNVMDYTQSTLADYFNINNNANRTLSNAIVCGQVLLELSKIKEKRSNIINSDLTEHELIICAVIQKILEDRNANLDHLNFNKVLSGYVNVECLYTVISFKIMKKGSYILIERYLADELNLTYEKASQNELRSKDMVRFFFTNPLVLEKIGNYIFRLYEQTDMRAFDTYIDYSNPRLIDNYEPRQFLYDEDISAYIKKIRNNYKFIDNSDKTKPKNVRSRPILQFNDDSEVIIRYDSVSDAVKETGINHKSIRCAASGEQRHAGGFVWKYEDEYKL